MSNPNDNISGFSDLEEKIKELTRIQQESVATLIELVDLKYKLRNQYLLAEVKKSIYSGIKKYFNGGE